MTRPASPLARAVFLDRDGTLIEERHYLKDPSEVVLLPGAAEGLVSLQHAGFLLIMVTNQSGIGRGYFTMQDAEAVNIRARELFAVHSVEFTEIYIAPEAPDQPSRGRKPSPQFLFDARDAFDVDLSASFIVGDKWIDLQCGWNAGVKASLLVRTGYGRETEAARIKELSEARIVDDMLAAAKVILRIDGKNQ